ncbi:MFS transporter [uncultured Thiohalocapsa sp.]|uniref:MFS transporter n=1 Tax=uncultured Thiohalocapsa sp. TaxID=768990 RepID=UPI0025D3E79B|nr:MFS transporter [uncultured Thiohalocapsa sp.]
MSKTASNRAELPPLNALERRAAGGLAAIFALRMLGLFMILPVFALYAHDLTGATPLLVGLAIGAYGLTQALLQIPFGLLSDHIGRKPVIYAGLILFALGSVIAALADSIHWVIVGRALQGSGAVAAAVIALSADLTRETVRTRAMAAIGISVALSFAAALVLGPVMGELIGVSGIFWLTAVFALLGMVLLARVVPSPARSATHRDAEPVLDQLGGVVADRTLLRLDGGIFLLHLTMVSLFVVLPLSLADAGLAAAQHWQMYLPVVLAAIVLMVPFIVVAERAGRVRAVLVGSAAALAVALLGFAVAPASLWLLAGLLTVMFTVFNLLEAVLPSLVSKAAGAGAKGTAMGVFASAQFTGAFLGGLLGGLAHERFGPEAVYLVGAGAALVWLTVAWTLRPPGQLVTHLLPLGELPATALPNLRERLLAVPGVEEAVIAVDEGVAHLKVDNRRIDWARLSAVAGAHQ